MWIITLDRIPRLARQLTPHELMSKESTYIINRYVVGVEWLCICSWRVSMTTTGADVIGRQSMSRASCQPNSFPWERRDTVQQLWKWRVPTYTLTEMAQSSTVSTTENRAPTLIKASSIKWSFISGIQQFDYIKPGFKKLTFLIKMRPLNAIQRHEWKIWDNKLRWNNLLYLTLLW